MTETDTFIYKFAIDQDDLAKEDDPPAIVEAKYSDWLEWVATNHRIIDHVIMQECDLSSFMMKFTVEVRVERT